MKADVHAEPLTWPWMAWSCAALAGFLGPAMVFLAVENAPGSDPSLLLAAPMLAIGLMGSGMIGAACARRLWLGMFFAIASGFSLVLVASAAGHMTVMSPLSIALAILIASLSFAARGALFSRSAGGRGWWIAVFVVFGEAAILVTSLAMPGSLRYWLLVLLPAQWTNMAIEAALSGEAVAGAGSALIALAGTAAATLLVARLWPRRWPYLVMFTTWLALSAVVYGQAAT